MNTTQLRFQIQRICNSTSDYIWDKTGYNLALYPKCTYTFDYLTSHAGMVAISIALGLFVLILVSIAVLKKLNSRHKEFMATLINIKEVTHDTKIFTFDLPNGWNNVGLKVGEHLTLGANIDGKWEERKYTPISRADVKRNSFQLLIKIYDLGKMSSYVNRMKKGDKIKVTLPFGKFNYIEDKLIRIAIDKSKAKLGRFDHLYLIGGGTGITPLYQIIQYITQVEAPEGKGPKISLLFANKSQSDILLKGQLQNFELSNPNFRCHFSVDKAESDSWTGYTGFIDDAKLRQTVPKDTSKTLFAACGPPIMVNLVEKLLNKNFNVPSERFFRF